MNIDIHNIGPIRALSLQVPDKGLVVFCGRNGCGKSTAISSIEAAVTGKGSLEATDGSPGGRVEAFGVTMTVSKSTRRKGELEVESLEGKLSISKLIDPQIKDEDAADRHRIKALIGLAGVDANIDLFADLGPELAIIPDETRTETDVVAMADQIKRAMDREALRLERDAEKARTLSIGEKNAAGDVDTTASSSAEQLQADLREAVRHETQLREARDNFTKNRQMRDMLLSEMETLPEDQSAVETAEGIEAEANQELQDARASVQDLEKQLAAAKQRETQAKHRFELAAATTKAARDRFERARVLTERLESIVLTPVSEQSIAAAAAEVARITADLSQCAVVERAKQHLANSQKHLADASALQKRADKLREIGASTDNVLSGIVSKLNTPLRIQRGRMVVETERSKDTLFSDLSAGQRAKIAIDIAVNVLGMNSVLTLSQEIWEGLDPTNRKMIADHAKARGVLILTAEATEGELSAVVDG